MQRPWSAGAALLALLLLAAGPALAGPAGRSYSSGGKSFSGGKSSSFSGGHSSSPPAGRSYSSGSKSSPVVPSGGRTSPVRPSGSSPAPRPSSPPAAKTSPSAPPVSRPSPSPPGGKSAPFNSPGPAPSSPAPPPASPGRKASFGSPQRVTGRTYSSGESTAAPPQSSKPPTRGYDATAGAAQRRQESKAVYTRGNQPKPTYADGKGQQRPVDPKDQRIEQLRRELDEQRWANRQQREQQYYGPYMSQPVVVYHDPYNSFFWWWLLAQSQDQRALWAYHHQADMDQARYQDLLARDRALEAKVHELEGRQVPRDPTYTPPGIDPDLVYTDDYVTAAYNPQPQPQSQPQSSPPATIPPHPAPRHHAGMTFITILAVMLLIGFVVWIVFFKRWNIS
jgi:hypothetical protein